MTGQPSTYRPRKLTPEQHEAARAVLEPIKRAEIRDDCHVLELEPGTRLVMVGLESACESGCRFHARQLNPVAAKLIFDLATKASMTIDVNDHVFVPEGVKSEHVGESYTTVVSTPDELSDKVTTPFVGGLTQYRGPVRNAP